MADDRVWLVKSTEMQTDGEERTGMLACAVALVRSFRRGHAPGRSQFEGAL
jgi:hypothetical protein